MSATVTDLFCGAGGSSLGAEASGMQLVMAANHWQTAIDVHQSHFPEAGHDVADISAADPRRYPVTDVLLASPECTNHSQARGVSRKKQQASLFDEPDPAAVKSRATMWDVPRFAEQNRYAAIVVENVIEATKWINWPSWCMAMEELGYKRTVLSHNSMHHGVAQSRDRIYVVFVRDGLSPNLEYEIDGWCQNCEKQQPSRQSWKNGRTVGRYRTQWIWTCIVCRHETQPGWVPASSIIDWEIPCPRIGDRKRPLAKNTRKRILAGLQRHGWAPIITAGAGNTYETTPGNRAKPLTEPLPTQATTVQSALGLPPGFMVQQVAASSRPTSEPVGTVSAGGIHHGLLVGYNGNGQTTPVNRAVPTVTGTDRHALLMRNNTGGGEMTTPVTEPARTFTSAAHQSLIDPATLVDDCGFRMLEPYETARAMAFPEHYIPRDLTKRDQQKLAGNAVCPPNMQWITGRILQALEQAA